MPWFLRVSSSSRNPCHGFLTIVSVYHRLRTHNTPKKENKFDIPTLNFTQMISRRRPLELDQIVVRSRETARHMATLASREAADPETWDSRRLLSVVWCEGCRSVKPLRVSADHLEPCHVFLKFPRICMASFLNVTFS